MAISPSKQPSLSIFFILFFFCAHFDSSVDGFSLKRLECLKVTPHEFVVSLKAVEDELQDAISVLQFELTKVNDDDEFCFSNAISTCLKLLDLSVKELSWCRFAVESSKGKYNGTGNLGHDLGTWLSAIHANTDTCMDELKETSVNMNDKISTKIDKVDSLVFDLLIKVEVQPISDHSTNKGRFPSWVVRNDKKLLQTNATYIFDAVVAADGTGDFTKVMDAVNAAPNFSKKRYVIFIKRGIYMENVEVKFDKMNLMMIGEGMDATIISGNLSHRNNNLSTFFTATFGVMGGGFIARDMSFRNTAGPMGEQAVALKSLSDLSVFYRCGIFGYQDSLYGHSNRQFYRDCEISGTVDFIFGYAIAVFQHCKILVKKGLPKQSNTIIAQGGKLNDQSTGFSIQFCNISADSDLLPFVKSISTFLGRPWHAYSTTIFMQSYISDVLSPKGWLEWNKSQYLDTLYYAEYKNYGSGARIQDRVKWNRYHVLNDSRQAYNFTVAQFISGNLWLPSTGVPFTPGFGSHF